MLKNTLKSASVLALALAGMSGAAVLATLRANAPAYPNASRRVFEKPVFHADKGEVVEVVRWGAPLTQVRTKNGRLGWIESGRLDTVNIPAVLSITKSATKAGKLSPTEDSALAKRWLDAQKAAKPVAPAAPVVAPAATVPVAPAVAPAATAPAAPAAAPAVAPATTPVAEAPQTVPETVQAPVVPQTPVVTDSAKSAPAAPIKQ